MLSDDQKRAHYDQFGHTDPNQQFGGFGGADFDFGGFGGFEDIFSSFLAVGVDVIRTRRVQGQICNIR